MKIKEYDADRVSLQVSLDELGTICNGVNEACSGIDVVNFEAKMGANLSEVDRIADDISNLYDKIQ